MDADNFWKILQSNNEWIRFADAKAGGILAIQGVIASVAVSELLKNRAWLLTQPVVLGAIALGGIAAALCVSYCLRCISPRLKPKASVSAIYFADISATYATPERYQEATNSAAFARADLDTQLQDQIWETAKIASQKYLECRRAFDWLGIEMALIGLTCVILFLGN